MITAEQMIWLKDRVGLEIEKKIRDWVSHGNFSDTDVQEITAEILLSMFNAMIVYGGPRKGGG